MRRQLTDDLQAPRATQPTNPRALRVPLVAIDRAAPARAGGAATTTRAVVWAVSGGRDPTPLSVDLGVSDGTYIEISGPGVRPGLKVAIPATARKPDQAGPAGP